MLAEKLFKPPKPPVVYTNPLRITFRNIVLGVIIGSLIVAILVLSISYFTANPQVGPNFVSQRPKTTPSATIATPSSQKDETAGWKLFVGPMGDLDIPKHSFKYPPTLKIALQPGLKINGVATDIENVILNGQPTKDIQFALAWDKEGYFQAIAYGAGFYTNIVRGYANGSGENENQGWKLVSKKDAVLGGKKATKALFTLLGKPNDKTIEYYSEFEQGGKTRGVTFTCSFVVTEKVDLEKQCDLMASTFRFD